MLQEFALAMIKGIGGMLGVVIILILSIFAVLYGCKWMDRGGKK